MASNILAVFCALIALVIDGFVIWAELGADKKNDDKEDKKIQKNAYNPRA